MAFLTIKTSCFFNPPNNKSVAQVAAQADVVFAARNTQLDTAYWTNLVANGFDRNYLCWYGKFDNGWDVNGDGRDPIGTPCSNQQPQRNSIAFELTCDMANARDDILAPDSSDWFLRKLSDGSIVVSQSANVNKYIHMDFSKASYRAHFKARFEAYFYSLPAAQRPKIIWLDNGRDNPMFTGTTIIPTQQFPAADGSDWFAASLDWIQWLIDNVCIPNQVGLAINFQTTGSLIERFKEYIDVMSNLVDAGLPARTFIEFYASTSSGAFEGTLNLWLKSPLKMQYAESRGVAVDCCVQLQGDLVQNESNATVNNRARLTLASYLLAMGAQSTLRYSDDDNVNGVGYGYFNIPPLFATYANIRQPVGVMYSTGTGIYRRDFVDGGYVIVNYSNPSSPTWQIVPGVGSTKKPLVSFLGTDMRAAVSDTKAWKVFAEAQDGGTLSYAVQTGALPGGRTINSSTGRVTGTYTTQGTFSGTIRVSETGGGFVDIPFTEIVDPGPPVPTANRKLGINYGGGQVTMANGDVFEAGTAAVFGTGSGGSGPTAFTCVQNGATDGTSASVISRDPSVPTHWTDAMFLDWLNDTTNPPPIVTIAETLNCDIRIGFNTGTTPAGRIVDIYINNVFKETIDFATFLPVETAFVRTYSNIAPVAGNFTIEARRNASATVSSRIMVMDMIKIPAVLPNPVLAPIGNKTVDEGDLLMFTISATASGGTPLLDATSPDGGVFDIGAIFADDEDGTGTFIWTPDFTESGVYTATFTATDPTDSTKVDSETITITVNHVNLPPTLNPIGNKVQPAGTAQFYLITATDPDGDALTFSISGNPDWIGLVGATPNSVQLAVNPGFADVGVYPGILITVSDGEFTDSETIAITIDDYGIRVRSQLDHRYRWHISRN